MLQVLYLVIIPILFSLKKKTLVDVHFMISPNLIIDLKCKLLTAPFPIYLLFHNRSLVSDLSPPPACDEYHVTLSVARFDPL